MMTVVESSRRYEAWLAKQVPLSKPDLELKHRLMSEAAFPFLRATFYRWVQLWPEVCPGLAKAPKVLAVGDLHIENFGTWRDVVGRLAWGVNDYDEVCTMPYTIDLVRLAASALLAIRQEGLKLEPAEACDALLKGYSETLQAGGRPFILAERNRWLRDVAFATQRDPLGFWKRLDALPTWRGRLPGKARDHLKAAMPERGLEMRIVHRQAGLGSLGRKRFTAIAGWRGGRVAREIKILVPSAYHWEGVGSEKRPILYQAALDGALRAPDPFLSQRGCWVVRRLAPDCDRVELAGLKAARSEAKLLEAMGAETANVHLADRRRVGAAAMDLASRPAKWLRKAASAMAEATLADWQAWRKR
jgi:hypothetical protein